MYFNWNTAAVFRYKKDELFMIRKKKKKEEVETNEASNEEE